MLRCCIKWQKSNQKGKRITKIFGLFENFWFFMKKSWKSWKIMKISWKSSKIMRIMKIVIFSWFSWFFHEKSTFFKKSKIFRYSFSLLIRFLPLNTPSEQVPAPKLKKCVFLAKRYYFFKKCLFCYDIWSQLANPTHVYIPPLPIFKGRRW